MNRSRHTTLETDGFTTRRRWLIPVLGLALLLTSWGALAYGAVEIPGDQVLGVLARKVGMAAFAEPTAQAEAVVWGIRVPRLLLGFTVGATLALVGGAMQGVLRNDLADPQLLGIGPGAGIGATVGSAAGGVVGGIAGGVATGVVTAFIVRRLARRASIDPTRIILAGVALGATLSAFVGFVVFGADRATVPPIEFWLLGSLSGATWGSFATVLVYVSLTATVLLASGRILDLLGLGEADASNLGVDVDLVQTVILIASGAAVGATVGAVGVIGFVGLLVPFLMRAMTGPRHRHLLPAAMVGGAIFVAASDLVARLALEPIEVPVGLVTAMFGGPVFLWLLSRRADV